MKQLSNLEMCSRARVSRRVYPGSNCLVTARLEPNVGAEAEWRSLACFEPVSRHSWRCFARFLAVDTFSKLYQKTVQECLELIECKDLSAGEQLSAFETANHSGIPSKVRTSIPALASEWQAPRCPVERHSPRGINLDRVYHHRP